MERGNDPVFVRDADVLRPGEGIDCGLGLKVKVSDARGSVSMSIGCRLGEEGLLIFIRSE